jgi:hypothetical protein
MTNAGFILLHRKIVENPLWTQVPPAWFKIWLAILLRANFRPTDWWDGRRKVELAAGTFVTSLETLADFAKASPKQVRGTLNFLERTGSVALKRTSRYTIISVTNWETYQNVAQQRGTRSDTRGGTRRAHVPAGRGQTEGKPRATEEQCNKETSILSQAIDAPEEPPFAGTTETSETEFNRVLEKVASEICGRHPAHRRTITSTVITTLRRICRSGAPEERIEKLGTINRRHAGWCASAEWNEAGGRYAPSLAKWLDPGRGLFEAEPPVLIDAEPAGTKYTRVQ